MKYLGEKMIYASGVTSYDTLDKYYELNNMTRFFNARGDININTQFLVSVNKYASFDAVIQSGSTRCMIEVKNRKYNLYDYGDVLIEWSTKIAAFRRAIAIGDVPLLLSFYADGAVVTNMKKIIEAVDCGLLEPKPHYYQNNNNKYDNRKKKKYVLHLPHKHSDILLKGQFEVN